MNFQSFMLSFLYEVDYFAYFTLFNQVDCFSKFPFFLELHFKIPKNIVQIFQLCHHSYELREIIKFFIKFHQLDNSLFLLYYF